MPRANTAAALVAGRAGDDRVGVRFEDRSWTWGDFVNEAAARASVLADLRTDGPFHVGVLQENTPEYLFTLGAAALAGAVVVGINPTRRGEELARDIRHTDGQLLLVDEANRANAAGLDLGLPAERVLFVEEGRWPSAVAAHAGAPVPTELPGPDELYLLIFTSGSSGAPKAVRMSQGRAAAGATRVPFAVDEVLYSAMPLFHGNALNAAVFPAWASGCTLVLRRRFSASAFLPDVRRYGATFFNTVGRAVAHIVATPPAPDDRDHPLRWVLGPETSAVDKAAFTERFGVPLFEGYGSSENVIILNPAPKAGPGALGVAPPGSTVAVLDPATGEERPLARFDEGGRLLNGEVAIGELVGVGVGGRFEGYYANPAAEAERLRGGDDYWSGDLAYRDEAGVFYFAGRAGDWLRVDGENFASAPVERILGRAPGVAGVAVYAVPDAATGDQVMAAVEAVPGQPFDPGAFAAFLAGAPDLGSKWAPRYVRVLDALPVTGTDKVDKAPLLKAAWRTADPVWHRPPRTVGYRPFTAEDVAELEAAMAANGRADLLG